MQAALKESLYRSPRAFLRKMSPFPNGLPSDSRRSLHYQSFVNDHFHSPVKKFVLCRRLSRVMSHSIQSVLRKEFHGNAAKASSTHSVAAL